MDGSLNRNSQASAHSDDVAGINWGEPVGELCLDLLGEVIDEPGSLVAAREEMVIGLVAGSLTVMLSFCGLES